jgi:hypothetical protein
MGRKLKYKTKEEKLQANRDKYMRFYWRNVEKIKKEKLKIYYENKRHTKETGDI